MRSKQLISFASGFIVTLLVISLLGHISLDRPQFPGLKRFWMYQSPSTNFFPTAKQLEAWAIQQIPDKDTGVVVIGGSSVLMGVGQPVDMSIAEELQQVLGSNFIVLNLALRGGSTFGQGEYISNSLRKKGYRVTLISDVFVNYVPPIENNWPYQKTYWQARYAGMLSPSNLPDTQIEVEFFNLDRILGFLNNSLLFQEVANYISYNYIPLTQSPAIGDQSLQPLKNYLDIEPNTPYENRYVNPDWEKSQLEMVKSNAANNYSDDSLRDTAKKLRLVLDRKFAPRILLVACKYNPRYVSQIEPTLKENYFENVKRQLKFYKQLGIEVESLCDDFSDREYSDGTHLSIEGAKKLASKLGKWVLNEIK
jgi:hypothetical protein